MEKNHVETSRRSRLLPQSQGRRFHSSPQLSPEGLLFIVIIDMFSIMHGARNLNLNFANRFQ